MTKKQLIFIGLTILVLTLTLSLSGCGREEVDLNGKNIVVFELNGGTLDYKTSSIDTKINFAYYPGTYILDPAEIPGYKLFRNGYVFTGWYTSADCNPNEKWDFDSKTFETDSLTLYAGWQKAIVYTFALYYIDGDETVKLGQYEVSSGDTFSDWRKLAEAREDHTPIGYFSDKELTTKWDNNTAHPGGEADLEIPIYVSYIEGDWSIASDVVSLRNAVDAGKNVYLTNDIDCNGEELYFGGSYNGVFEGNGYTVSNFTVNKSGGIFMPQCSIFSDLGEKSEIRNVSFKNVTYKLFGITSTVRVVKVSALAKSANGTKVTNVTVEGKMITDYEGELPMLLSPFYDETSVGDVSGFTAEITVEKQTQ